MRIRRSGLPGRMLLSAVGAATLSLALTGADAGAEPGDGVQATGAEVDKLGWWHERNVATDTPAAIVTVPPPPGVPAGTLAVGAVNGEADRLAAIGILPEAVPGDTIRSFTLTIKEAAAPAVNANSEAAKIVACPITSFWVAAENGTWATRPEFDCALASAPGTRAADGTWTFDLLPIGQAWTDPAGSITADGVVLVEDATSPDGFQAVFATEGEGALVVTIEATQGADDSALDPSDGGFTDGAISDGAFDSGTFDAGSGGALDLPAVGGGAAPVEALPAPEVAAPAASAPPLVAAPVALASPNILGNLPGGVALMIPMFLGLLALLSISLGPAGEPVAATRQGGVSRALAARDHPRSPTLPREVS